MEDSATSLPNHNSDPSPQIQQNVEGDGNQVIGQVTGGNVFGNITGNVTIYDRVPVSSMPPPISMLPTLTQQEYRQRQVLLDKVQKFWVKGVLENSLHTRALIELGLQERLDLVKQPFSGVGEFLNAPGQVLPDGTQATAVFDEMGEGRTLLILGEPGAGKTIALLKLAEDLIVRTAPDLRQQIPVVFNLSSWARKPQTIEKWLVQELLEKYQVSKALGETWVKSEALILLLDGLDEVQSNQRNACVQALNLFMQNHGTTEVIVCCRIRDYQVLKDRLTLRSAICIQPLTPQQANDYFDRAGNQLSALKTVLLQDEILQELATSPLMLSIMSLAYQNFTPEELTLGGKTEDYRKHLFATYIDRMSQRRGMMKRYPNKETKKWLIWLAKRMNAKSQTVFLIERLQPSWLATRSQQIRYRLESGFVGGLIIMIISAIYGGQIYGLIYQLFGWEVYGHALGITSGLIYGLFYGSVYGVQIIFFGDIKPIESLRWSWQEARNIHRSFWVSGMILGLIFGVFSGTIMLIQHGLSTISLFVLLVYLFICLLYSMFFGLVGGVIVGSICGFRCYEIQQREQPNQGIIRSYWNFKFIGITVFFIVGLSAELFFGLGNGLKINGGLINPLNCALSAGLSSGLIYGGSACIRHFALRLILYCNRCVPWNYAHFLDYATERLFLQKVGGGYIFVHRMLLEHFAEMSPEQENR
jgi:hypothetical protein